MKYRKFLLVTLALSASILTACGGGGGGGSTSTTTTPPPIVGNLAITPSTLSPAEGGSVATNAELTVGFVLTNSTFQSAGRSTLSCGATGQPKQAIAYTLKPVVAPVTSVTVVPAGGVPFGTDCTHAWVIDGTGGATDSKTVNFKVATLKYTDKVIAIWNGGYPYLVNKTGMVKVINKTQYQAGFIPLGICDLGYPQLTDGKVLSRCTNAVATPSTPALTRVISYIDPIKGEMYDFTGTVPTNVVWRSFENNADKPEWGAKARVSDGWYYVLFNSDWILNFQPDSGAVTTVKAGTFLGDGNINILIAYSN